MYWLAGSSDSNSVCLGLVHPCVYWWNGSLDHGSVVYAVVALEFLCDPHRHLPYVGAGTVDYASPLPRIALTGPASLHPVLPVVYAMSP